MKKLMIAAAIVCAAVASQAASVTWENPANWAYGTAVNINDGSGVAKAVQNGLNVYIFDGQMTSQQAIYTLWTQHNDLTEATGFIDSASTSGGKFTKTITWGEQSVSGGASYYYDFFFVVDGGDQIFLSTSKTHQKSNNSATAKALTLTSIGDSTSLPVTGGVAGKWNNVPEPTSGLLLLLGVAGLALRRRRA